MTRYEPVAEVGVLLCDVPPFRRLMHDQPLPPALPRHHKSTIRLNAANKPPDPRRHRHHRIPQSRTRSPVTIVVVQRVFVAHRLICATF